MAMFAIIRGDLASKSSRWQKALMKMDYDINPGSPNYGRKVDLQCNVDKFEISNSEFKTSSASIEQIQVQLRKNLRLNQSMVLYIHNEIKMPLEDLEVLALDVRGLTGSIFNMKYRGDVFVSDLASSHVLRLPEHDGRWERFLEGKTLAVLLNYVRRDSAERVGRLTQEWANGDSDYDNDAEELIRLVGNTRSEKFGVVITFKVSLVLRQTK
ncbi:hypothetical protein BGZ65_005676 [Modicella reniformis]|uniref:Uncharacterized protein n=1 Tax=Modicella reniformis TaxID=1440133 RepID=A0A9P6INT3_9FUNG|nr:hypothetical protein BGZ65_005676 [Modicella reniformis]